jgi:hypothetical protein
MSRLAIGVCAAQLFFLGATAMSAQDSSYDENALRVESRYGDLQIVRGVQGTVVARAGIFRGPKVASIVSRSERALAEARVFERDYQPGQSIIAIGIATLGVAIGAWRIPEINPAIPTGLTIVSVSLITYGGMKLESAYRALSKAIWWYNRDLKE